MDIEEFPSWIISSRSRCIGIISKMQYQEEGDFVQELYDIEVEEKGGI